MLVAAGLATVVAACDDARPDATPASTAAVAPTVTAAPSTPAGSAGPTVTTPRTSTPEPATATAGAAAPDTQLSRPIINPDRCAPQSARDRTAAGVQLFARSSEAPVPIQVIADPASGPAGRFAIVQRYGDPDPLPPTEAVAAGEFDVHLRIHDNGNGQANWHLGDGTEGAVRSRGLDRDTLLGVVAALTPRSPGTAIPGFDYVPSPDAPLQLLHEQMNSDVVGVVRVSECLSVATGLAYRVAAISGDPLFQYGGVIDRSPPLEVGVVGSTLVVLDGPADPAQPTLADVVDASDREWVELTAQVP